MNYDKVNGKVGFVDSTHVYENLDTKKKYTSVTTLIGKYAQPFDSEFWSAYKALEKVMGKDFTNIKKELLNQKKFEESSLKSLNISKEDFINARAQILQEWKDTNKASTDRGTAIHAKMENSMYELATNVSLKKYGIGGKFDVSTKYESFLNTESGIFPEYLVYNDELGLAGQIDLLVKNNNDIQVLDYKGLPLDTLIPTPDGFTTMENLYIGDIVYDKEGKECKVIHKSDTHYKDCIKLKFDNNDEIVSDKDHRWLVHFLKGGKPQEKVMTTEEIYWHIQDIRDIKKKSELIPKIYNAEPIKCEYIDLPIDPYVLGCWLGDGHSADGKITQENPDLWEEIIRRGYKLGDDVSQEGSGNAQTRTVIGMQSKLRELNLLHNKHIPIKYLRASYEQRLDLLRGLMDTDGYYHPKRKRFVMNSPKEWQTKTDFIELLGSLGIKATIFEDLKAKCEGKTFTTNNTCFSTTDLNPFLVRNQDIEFPKTNKCTFRNIVDAEFVDIVPTQCIEVDSESHTYLFGRQHIVTHNTNKSIDLHSYYNPKTRSHQMMQYPLNTVEDCNYFHYALQLSTYAYMLQKWNPDFNITMLKLVHFPHEGGEVYYDVPYLKDEVERMIKHYNKQNSSNNRLKRIQF